MSVICSAVNASAPSIPDVFCNYAVKCYRSKFGSYVVSTFTISSIVFLLPVYVFILHLGFKQWRQQRFSTMAMSHFDLFAYNMVLIELLNVMASICVSFGIHTYLDYLLWTGDILCFVSGSGQLLFHTLTCAERHLAVVHPVTYLSLKEERWIRARNALIAFIWLLLILVMAGPLVDDTGQNYSLPFALTILELVVILLFSVCILRGLICSGPGNGIGRRHHVSQSKLTALYVTVTVLVVLMLRLTWTTIGGFLVLVPRQQKSLNCMFMLFTYWLGLPSSLIIPILYLKRKEKLFRKKKNEPKQLKA